MQQMQARLGDGGPRMQAANIDDQIMLTNKAFGVAVSTVIATMLFCLLAHPATSRALGSRDQSQMATR
jgi:hypothetical protein